INTAEPDGVRQVRLNYVRSDDPHIGPVYILERRLGASTAGYHAGVVPIVVEAEEEVDRTCCVPVEPSRGITDAHRRIHASGHLREEYHRCGICMSIVGFVKALPVHEPEELVLAEGPAGMKPDLATMEWIVFAGLAGTDPGGKVLVSLEIEETTVILVA